MRSKEKELALGFKLSEEDVLRIEKSINKFGTTETVVKVEQGKIVVLQVEKKKIV